MRILFVSNVSQKAGAGHASRCLILADQLNKQAALSREEVDITFAFPAGGQTIFSGLSKARYNKLETPDEHLWDACYLQCEYEGSPDVIIVDSYDCNKEHETAFREWCNNLVVLDDLVREHDCALLFDETLMRKPQEYTGKVPANCFVLAGSFFALVPEEFVLRRSKRRDHRASLRAVKKVMVFMGVTDRSGISAVMLKAVLQSADPSIQIDIVMGKTASSLLQVQQLAAKAGDRVSVHVDIPMVAGNREQQGTNFLDLMAGCDFAVGAGGTASWQRCTLGIPSLVIATADCQTEISRNLGRSGAAIYLSMDEADEQRVAQELKKVLNDPGALASMAQHAEDVTDGRGAERVATQIFRLVKERELVKH